MPSLYARQGKFEAGDVRESHMLPDMEQNSFKLTILRRPIFTYGRACFIYGILFKLGGYGYIQIHTRTKV